MSGIVVRAESLAVVPADPIAVQRARVDAATRAAADRLILVWLVPAAVKWQMNGHPRPLPVDGHAYRRRTRKRKP